MSRNKLVMVIAFMAVAIFFFLFFAQNEPQDLNENNATPEVTEPSAQDESTASDEKIFTLDELKQYNGKDGKPAYVAVDGIVYDVSASDKWKNGDHNGFEAGNDLTDEIKNVSPHGVKMLDRVPVVGKLAE